MSERVCPRCKRTYIRPPALSRYDNATEICPPCGITEAFEVAGLVPAFDGDIYWKESDDDSKAE